MTLLVRDEEDIVSSMIDYHLERGVDFIIATDNRSVDKTEEILRRYEQRGVLHYIYEPADDYSQSRWVTKMARMAATQFRADWVINSDADEFWWPNEGDLRSTLQNLDDSIGAVYVERMNFVPTTSTGEGLFANHMIFRELRSTTLFGDPLPGKVCHRSCADISISQGNHEVSRDGRVLATVAASLTILHFPMRTYRQFANKIAKGGAAYSRNTELSAQTGVTWRRLYERWQCGELSVMYDSLVFDEAKVENGLKEGSLLFDDRLKQYLTAKTA